MRIFLSTLTVMMFVFGIALERPILIALAGLLLLIVVASLVWMLRRRSREEQEIAVPESSKSTEERERELRNLGIMSIRPKAKKDNGDAAAEEESASLAEPGEEVVDEETPGGVDSVEEPSASHPAVKEPKEEMNGEEKPQPNPPEQAENGTPSEPEVKRRSVSSPPALPEHAASLEEPAMGAEPERITVSGNVLKPYLESLRALIGARTVALLRQEEIALEYEVEALVSSADNVLHEGMFSTSTPLLTASMAQRPVTVQRIGERALPPESLGYYRGPATTIRQIILAPVEHAYEPASFFLLADTTEEGGFNADRPRQLMRAFSELLATILAEGELDTLQQNPDTRPRREIIAEEMAAAQEHDHPLALALVYLNRAEALADEGEESVAAAERMLEGYLEDRTSRGRVERFGELTYGIFYPAPVSEVETWAMQLQSEVERKGGRLEGGISIGIAMLAPRHDTPDALRADATEALREAYETGTCTILE